MDNIVGPPSHTSSVGDYWIYYEVQQDLLCGRHALNTLMQADPIFTDEELYIIAHSLEQQELELMNQDANVGEGVNGSHFQNDNAYADASGNFAFQVLEIALRDKCGLDLERLQLEACTTNSIMAIEGFICHRNSHWFTIRKIDGQFWNLDSCNKAKCPILLSEKEVKEQLQSSSQGSIFSIASGLPPPRYTKSEQLRQSTSTPCALGSWWNAQDAVMTCKKREAKLERERNRKCAARAKESVIMRRTRNEKNKLQTRNARCKETLQQKAHRLRKANQDVTQRNNNETPQRKARRLRKANQDVTQRNNNETPEHKAQRLRKAHQYVLQARSNETPEHNAQRLQKAHQSVLQARSSETPQSNAVRLQNQRKASQSIRDAKKDHQVINFQTIGLPDNPQFAHFEDDAEVATMLWHLNSGSQRFAGAENLHSNDPIQGEELLSEIKSEMLTPDEREELIQQFLKVQGRGGYCGQNFDPENPDFGRDARIITCGACGYRDFHRAGTQFHEHSLDQLGMLSFTEDHIKRFNIEKNTPPITLPHDDGIGTLTVEIHKMRSAYQSIDPRLRGRVYHLHPEFIHTTSNKESTYLCASCNKAVEYPEYDDDGVAKMPPNSIAAGVDFGDFQRLGISPPNPFEIAIIATVRHYHNLVKIQPNGTGRGSGRKDNSHSRMRGHHILFPDETSSVAAIALALQHGYDSETLEARLAEYITIHLVGPEGQMDLLARQTLGCTKIVARASKIYQFLAILQITNDLYKEDPPIPEFAELQGFIERVNNRIVESAVRISDKDSLNAEHVLGDDVCQVRTTAHQHDHQLLKQTTTDDDTHFSYSSVSKTHAEASNIIFSPTSNIPTDAQEAQDVIDLLQEAATAFDIDVSEGIEKFHARRGTTPLNEFEEDEYALAAAFPHIFIYGWCYKGQLHRKSKSLSKREIKHLLFQYTTHPAQCRELIFYLFDKHQRHSSLQGMAAKVKANPEAFETFSSLITSKNFQETINSAVSAAPSGEKTKELLSTILPVMDFAGKKTLFGAFEQTASTSKLGAMTQRYTAGTTFFTISPNDISNSNSFRLSMKPHNNTEFPAVSPDAFFEAMKNDTSLLSGSVTVPVDYTTRAKATISNPVATTIEYQVLIENMLSVLMGICPAYAPGTGSKSVRTWYYKDPSSTTHHKGVFGHLLAFFGVHETQHRGALHFHAILYGGLSPKLLECASEFQDICDVISQVLSTMYTAKIPREMHMKHLLNREMKRFREPLVEKRPPGALLVPPSFKESQGLWEMHAFENCIQTNVHVHSPTCYQPPSGCTGCRGAKPSGLSESTAPVQLIPKDNTEDGKRQVPSVQSFITPRVDCSGRDVDKEPVPLPDERLIVWELARPELASLPELPQEYHDELDEEKKAIIGKEFCIQELISAMENDGICTIEYTSGVEDWLTNKLNCDQVLCIYDKIKNEIPERNGYIAEFNDTITNLTGSSVNAVLLGNAIQARNAMYYLTTYVSKNKVHFGNCLTALNEASKHAKKFPSTAEDTGTAKRTTQHVLTRVLNSMNKHMEVSDTQAVLALLNQGAPMCSETFAFYGAADAVHYVNRMIHDQHMKHKGYTLMTDPAQDEEDDGDGDDSSTDSDNDDEVFEDDTATTKESQADSSIIPPPHPDVELAQLGNYKGKAKIYNLDPSDPAKKIPVDYQDHYRYRGAQLSQLSRQEYFGLVAIKPKPKNDDTHCHHKKDNERAKTGRKKSRLYDFAVGHPLHGSHVQYLKSKQNVLIFTGRRPSHPGLPPSLPADAPITRTSTLKLEKELKSWRRKADRFAMYFLVAFRPEHTVYDQDNLQLPSYNWDALCEWVSYLESQDTLISKLRLDAMFNNVCARSNKNVHRTAIASYRMRNHTIWSKEQQKEAMALYESARNTIRAMSVDNELAAFLSDSADLQLDTRIENNAKQELEFLSDQNMSLDALFDWQPIHQNPSNVSGDDSFDSEIEDDLCSDYQDDGVRNISRNIMNAMDPMSLTDFIRSIRRVKSEHVYSEMDRLLAEENAHQLIQEDSDSDGDSICPCPPPPIIEPVVTRLEMVEKQLSKLNLSSDQKQVLNEVKGYFEEFVTAEETSTTLPPPLRLLCTGGPGVGKSFLIQTISEMCQWFGAGRVIATSFNGIAAVNVDGTTICSLFGFQATDRSKTNVANGNITEITNLTRLTQMRKALDYKNLRVLIVDECSTMDPISVAVMDSRLKQVMSNNEDFGGVAVIFVGDFWQLPPVKALSLPHSVMKVAELLEQEKLTNSASQPVPSVTVLPPHPTIVPQCSPQHLALTPKQNTAPLPVPKRKYVRIKNSLMTPVSKMFNKKKKKNISSVGRYGVHTSRRRGIDLFRKFKRMHLTTQQRAVRDPIHTKFINNLSNGAKITMQDLQHYKKLTKADIDNGWKFAPILVATNRERCNIVHRKVMLFAQDHDTYIFRWRVEHKNWKNCPHDQLTMADIANSDPCFWEYFVFFADAFLTHNVNTDLGLANGTAVKLHSITFASTTELLKVQNRTRHSPPGSVITLDQPPLAVNITIPATAGEGKKRISSKKKAQFSLLKSMSISEHENEIIIPLKQDKNSCKFQLYTVRGGSAFSVGTVETRPFFTFDLAFAMTVHKSQGRTIPLVVIAISEHPLYTCRMDYASVFVGMTRIEHTDNLRLLYHNCGSGTGERGLEYITRLNPNSSVLDYYAGFENSNGFWDPLRSLLSGRTRSHT